MRALVLIDLQRDFLPGGTLAVPEGDAVVPVANRLAASADLVVATRDWHPPDHSSFATSHPGRRPGEVIDLGGVEQTLWPPHCVQNTRGARFAPALDTRRIQRVFDKGIDREFDSYSGFFDNAHRRSTGLPEYLGDKGGREVWLVGLATDYCVRFSALDARALGLRTVVVREGCRGIDLQPGDVGRAFEEMRLAGVEILDAPDPEWR